jgi:uncharacterized membrane protein YsdA (DUF1294 family)
MLKTILVMLAIAAGFVGAWVALSSTPSNELKEFFKWALVVVAGIVASVVMVGSITLLF